MNRPALVDRLALLAAPAALLGLACGSRSPLEADERDAPPPPDGGIVLDGGVDAGPGPPDAGLDGGPDAGPSCDAGNPAVLATDATRNVAVDGDWVYYNAENTLQRVPKCGGPSEVLVADRFVQDIRVLDGFVWYTGPGTVERVDLAGATPFQILHGPQQWQTSYLVVDSELAFFTEWLGGAHVLRSMPNPTGPVATFFEVVQSPVASDDSHVFFLESTQDGHEVRRAPREGGAPEFLAETNGQSTTLEVDDAHLYWSFQLAVGQFRVLRVPKAGGPIETVYAGPEHAVATALNDTHVFIGLQSSGTVLRVDKGTLAQQVVAQDLATIMRLAIDHQSMFVVNLTGTKLEKRAMP